MAIRPPQADPDAWEHESPAHCVRLPRYFTVIDPDLVEAHNIPETDLLTPDDIGRAKVVPLARHLNGLGLGVRVLPITAPIQELYAIDAAKKADVLVCAADDAAARLTVGLIATAHHRVCCDIGTAVLEAPSPAGVPGRRLGADLRIVLPLDGCLQCRGGVLDYQGGVRRLVGLPARERVPPHFSVGRAGSLRSWNSIAVAVAIRGLEDLLTGRMRGSSWIRIEDEGGIASISYPLSEQRVTASDQSETVCEMCRQAGMGDDAL